MFWLENLPFSHLLLFLSRFLQGIVAGNSLQDLVISTVSNFARHFRCHSVQWHGSLHWRSSPSLPVTSQCIKVNTPPLFSGQWNCWGCQLEFVATCVSTYSMDAVWNAPRMQTQIFCSTVDRWMPLPLATAAVEAAGNGFQASDPHESSIRMKNVPCFSAWDTHSKLSTQLLLLFKSLWLISVMESLPGGSRKCQCYQTMDGGLFTLLKVVQMRV